MKHWKQILAAALSAVLLCGVCFAGFSISTPRASAANEDTVLPQSVSSFTDVAAEAWYAEAVSWCQENGIMSGTSATAFSPESSMTRAMMVTVLYRAAGTPASTGENVFTDNIPGSWYYDAVIWAAVNNVLAGYGDGSFGSGDPVTREQAAVILHRYAGSPDAGTALTAADASAVSSYAVNAVTWASANGLLRTDDSGYIHPKTNAARAEVAYMLYRHLANSAPQTPTLTTDSQEPASNQGMNESSSQKDDIRAVITINGKDYGMTITNTVVGRAFAQKLEAEGGYKVTGSRAADDICCSESESLETDTSENMSWECGGVAWFDGWFTIWVSAAPSGRNRPVVAQINKEHLEELQALSGSVEITVQLATASDSSEESSETEDTAMPQLKIEADGQTFTATLQDNPTARALLEQLPMTISMGELNGNEKYFYLPDSLPANSQKPGSIHAGDLMLYGSDCLVLFYESFSSSYSYTRIGSIDDPSNLAAALGRGSIDVTFQKN